MIDIRQGKFLSFPASPWFWSCSFTERHEISFLEGTLSKVTTWGPHSFLTEPRQSRFSWIWSSHSKSRTHKLQVVPLLEIYSRCSSFRKIILCFYPDILHRSYQRQPWCSAGESLSTLDTLGCWSGKGLFTRKEDPLLFSIASMNRSSSIRTICNSGRHHWHNVKQ